ncbi:MAG TPA: hypothetical protein VD926_14320 [Acidimicrobiales bacterium]|nr:hypothetical protein [Acidimicrobiales bacterium]
MNDAVLDDLRAAFELAASRVPPVEATIDLAGEPVRFRVAGPELAAVVLRPFAPLRTVGAPVATVQLWSGEECGVDLPASISPEPWRIHAGDQWMVHVQGRAATGLDRGRGDVVGHRVGPGALTAHERTKLFPEVLALWLLDRGALKLHAGCVEGALLVGKTGSGKSTAALAAAAAGRPILGDDHVAVRDGTVHAVSCVVRILPEVLEAAPWLREAGDVADVPGDKSMVFLHHLGPPAPVRVVLAPTAAPGDGLRPLRPAEALRVLAPSTLLGVVGGGPAAFQAMGDLVSRVPAFALHHGGNPRRAAELIGEALG